MNIRELIQLFLPVFFFHTDERYFPASMEYAFNHCQLYNGTTMIADYGGVKPDMIQNNIGHRIRIHPTYRIGEFSTGNSDDIPVYVVVKNHPDVDYYEITYALYFAYSAPYRILGRNVGDHDSDLEHVSVRVAKNTGDLFGMYFSYHSEGLWRQPQDIEFIDGRPVVYVARGSHGFYPYDGTHCRIFGFANDVMDQGIQWKPTKVVRIDMDKNNVVPPYWMYYRGQLSMDGVDNFPLKGWFRDMEPEVSSTMIRDCCFPCWFPRFCLCSEPFIPVWIK